MYHYCCDSCFAVYDKAAILGKPQANTISHFYSVFIDQSLWYKSENIPFAEGLPSSSLEEE